MDRPTAKVLRVTPLKSCEYMDHLEAENKRLREALIDAADSLETIAHRKGFTDHDDFVANVRPYAASRELAARSALLKEGDDG